jgi:hypothetical protein
MIEHWSLVDILIISQIVEHLTVAGKKHGPQVRVTKKKAEIKKIQPVQDGFYLNKYISFLTYA